MTLAARGRRTDDTGAALILAIGFVLMIGAISAGIAALVTSSVNNRGSLELVRNRQYAADGAIETAITQVRQTSGFTFADCTADTGSTTDTLNGVAVRVEWISACRLVRGSDGAALAQRNVVFSSCVNLAAACLDADVLIRAEVNFQQNGVGGPVTMTYVQSWSVRR